jgi:hypothetical protein
MDSNSHDMESCHSRYKGELAEREELAQEETKRKQNMVGQFYNKGGYGYMLDPDDFKTIK